MYGHPAVGKMANKLLKKRLALHGYVECKYTPGLWHRPSTSIKSVLIVDDFGILYTDKQHVLTLIKILKQWYELTTDWGGKTFCGISLSWDYKNRWVDLTLPGYIEKVLQCFKHGKPKRPQDSPFPASPQLFEIKSQTPQPLEMSPKLEGEEIT